MIHVGEGAVPTNNMTQIDVSMPCGHVRATAKREGILNLVFIVPT
jgi:hypothetical protein